MNDTTVGGYCATCGHLLDDEDAARCSVLTPGGRMICAFCNAKDAFVEMSCEFNRALLVIKAQEKRIAALEKERAAANQRVLRKALDAEKEDGK